VCVCVFVRVFVCVVVAGPKESSTRVCVVVAGPKESSTRVCVLL